MSLRQVQRSEAAFLVVHEQGLLVGRRVGKTPNTGGSAMQAGRASIHSLKATTVSYTVVEPEVT